MLPWLSSLTVESVLVWRLRHRWSPKDYRILPLPLEYPRPLPVPSPTVSLASLIVSYEISLKTFWTGYERFKPNNRGYHSWRGYYRGGWHPSYPPLILGAVYTPQKHPLYKRMHSRSLPHTCVHWESFAPAAPRRVWILVSESISELPLSRLVRIIGLPGRYPNNNLIRCSPILKRKSFRKENIPVLLIYQVLASVSRDYP